MKRKIALFTAVLLIAAFTAYGISRITERSDPGKPDETSAATPQSPESGVETNYLMDITDSKGNIIKLKNEPERVISVGPDITEIIFALGRGDRLAGRSAFCNYPPEAQDIAVVGDFYEWNLETIISLEPDVIFVSAMNTEENEKKLKDLGINIIFVDQTESFEGVYETIALVGKVLNAEAESTQIINRMKQTVEKVHKAVEDLERPSVYYIAGYGEYGDYTATGETFIAKMLHMAGGANIAADITGWNYSLEKLMEEDPYIIIGSEDAKNYFQQASGYKELTAVKEGRIYSIDVDLLEIQGPRISDGLLELAGILHPDESLE